MLSSLFYVGLGALGIPRAARSLRRAGTILCYHNVVLDGTPAQTGLAELHMPLAQFEAQARWLARHYDIVRLRDLVDRVESGERLRHVAALTFDDGYAGTFQHAVPVLTALGIPAAVFVVADAPGHWDAFSWDRPYLAGSRAPTERSALDERWHDEASSRGGTRVQRAPPVPRSIQPADWRVIAAAARQGVDIGVHSASHARLPRLTDTELRREVVESRRVIERETGVTPDFFAYPYGLWDERVRAAVRAAGYRGAVTVDPGLTPAGSDPWALRRTSIPASLSGAAFRAYTAGLNPRWALR